MKALIINFSSLNIGGIEQFIYNLTIYMINKHYRVIWFCQLPMQIADGYKGILDKIEVVEIKKTFTGFMKYKQVILSCNEEYTMISFTPFDHIRALQFAQENIQYDIRPFYIVANTKGRYYFIEEYFYGFFRKVFYKYVKELMEIWENNDYIRFFTCLQAEALEKQYGMIIKNKEDKCIPSIIRMEKINEELLSIKSKTRKKEFNLVTVSRFDFPHKNYLLGLIDDYGKLKKKYPQLRLHIAGYGVGESKVKKNIDSLDIDAQKDVYLYGPISSTDMPDFMKSMHLNISVAGSVSCGAINGVLSIPARNFCGEKCEVYGYLPESNASITATKPGEPAINYIEEVVDMSDEKYIEKCVDSYKNYMNRKYNPEYLFEQSKTPIVSPNHKLIWAIMWMFRDISYKLHNIIKP